MSEPFLGETRIFAFGFAPDGWLACAGQLLSVGEFPDFFKLIGTRYGGDGTTTFALPNVAPIESEGGELTVCISLFGAPPSGG